MANNQSNHSSKSSKIIYSCLLMTIIMMNILPQSTIMVMGRYLPTRSNNDQLRRQEIKEILRLLLDASSSSSMNNNDYYNDQQRLIDSPGWPNSNGYYYLGAILRNNHMVDNDAALMNGLQPQQQPQSPQQQSQASRAKRSALLAPL